MNKLQLIALLTFVLVATATNDLWFNGLGSKLDDRDNQYYKFQVPCEGGSGEYDYDYDDIPSDWDTSDDGLLIPRNYREGRYQVKVIAYDIEYRVSAESYVVIELRGGKDYEVFIRESYDTSYNIEYFYQIQDRDIYEYPSWSKIQNLIEDGDITQLKGIIMKAIDSDNDCDDKRQFLTALLNRIDKFLRDNDQDIQEARDKIKDLQKEQTSLEKRLKVLKEEKKGDSFEDIKADLKKVQNKIAWYEKRIRDNKKKVDQYEDDIAQYNKRIWELKDKTIPDLEKTIKRKQNDQKDVEWKIKEGKGDIPWLKKQLKNIKDDISRKEKQIKEAEKDIKDFEKKIDWFKKKISSINKTISSDENKLSDYKKQEYQLQKDLKDSRAESEIDKEIKTVERRINAIKGEVKKLENTITRIEKSIYKLKKQTPDFRMTIEKSYYSCKDFENVYFSDISDGLFVSRFDTRSFQSYLEQGYGINDGGRLGSDIRVVKVNLFSGVWSQSYGPAFTGYGSRFGNVFGCQISGGSHRSKITKINSNSIYVAEEGRDYQVRVGDCSVLESATGRDIPKVGDNFVWKGEEQAQKGVYQLSKGLCY